MPETKYTLTVVLIKDFNPMRFDLPIAVGDLKRGQQVHVLMGRLMPYALPFNDDYKLTPNGIVLDDADAGTSARVSPDKYPEHLFGTWKF